VPLPAGAGRYEQCDAAGFDLRGSDVQQDSISAAILRPRLEVPDVEKISTDDESVRRFIGRFTQPKQLRVCYEAAPTRFGVARLLTAMNVSCEVSPLITLGRVVLGCRTARPGGKGYWYEPTLVADLDENAEIAQTEVSGPS